METALTETPETNVANAMALDLRWGECPGLRLARLPQRRCPGQTFYDIKRIAKNSGLSEMSMNAEDLGAEKASTSRVHILFSSWLREKAAKELESCLIQCQLYQVKFKRRSQDIYSVVHQTSAVA